MSTPTATPRTDDEETPLITNHRVSAETYKRMVDLARTLETELAQLRADLERFTGHGLLDCHAICDQRDAAVAERDQLRAEVERLNALGSWAHTCIHHTDAERKAWVACPCCANARAERAEAALAFIAANGGTTHETECGPIACNGSWCAQQARAAIDAAMKP